MAAYGLGQHAPITDALTSIVALADQGSGLQINLSSSNYIAVLTHGVLHGTASVITLGALCWVSDLPGCRSLRSASTDRLN